MGIKLAFRHQRAIFGFVVLGLVIAFSTAVLWSHYEKIVLNYQWLAKAGLALVDVIAVGLAIWHFYAKHTPLKVWCFIAEGVIAAMMLIHAGAVLQLDSSTAQQTAAVQTAADVQVKLIEAQGKANAETEAARIKAAGQAAVAVRQQTGSTSLASKTLQTGNANAPAQAADNALVKQASGIKATTFLSEGYMRGGMYYWPALIAFGLFFVAMGISAFAESVEDANYNKPDATKPAGYVPSQPVGFAPRRPMIHPASASKREENMRGQFTTTPEKPTTHVSSEMDDTSAQHETTRNDTSEGLKRLRETLKLIAFHSPGLHFKADVKADCVWIRAMVSRHGIQRTESSAKAKLSLLDDALAMPEDAFRARLEKFLKSKGFDL